MKIVRKSGLARYVMLLSILLFCHAAAANQDDFPKPSGPASVLPARFNEKVEMTPVDIFLSIDDHFQIMSKYFDGLPDGAEQRAMYALVDPENQNKGRISTAHPMLNPQTGVAAFVNELPQAYLKRKSYWLNLWSQGMSPNQTLKRNIKVRVGASKESVNSFTQVVASVKVNFQDSSGQAQSDISHQSLTISVEEERTEEEALNLTTASGESATFTMWQYIEELAIVDKNGNALNIKDALWRIYPSVEARKIRQGEDWQAQATYHQAQPVEIRGQRFLDKAVLPVSN